MKVEFLDRFSKNASLYVLIKFRPVWANLFLADGKTDRQRWRS